MTEKVRIHICMGSSCFARRNRDNLAIIERFLAEHGLTEAVELCGSHCEGRCAEGPNVTIDGVKYTEVDPPLLIDLLNSVFNTAIMERA